MITLYTADAQGYYTGSVTLDEHAALPPFARSIAPPALDGSQVARWTGAGWEVLDGMPPAPPTPIPTEVTMRQARLALLGAGLLSQVDAAIASLPEPDKSAAQIDWEYAAVVQRSSGLVPAMGAALGMTEAQIDALFVTAANL